MSQDYTPARLRELADTVDRYFAGYTPQFAAALRAAAHELELAEETAREGAKERLEADAQYRATLAAREALLWQAHDLAKMTLNVASYELGDCDAPDFGPQELVTRARALAAEIAAALRETDQ